MTKPEILDDELYQLLRNGKIDEFNQKIDAGAECSLVGADLRALDLRKLHTEGLDMQDSYLRMADLRGVDLSNTNLEGASISGAKISGTYFPKQLRAEEINLSLTHGTRMRYIKLKINLQKPTEET